AAPRKYPEELRERVIRMAVDLRRDRATRSGALRRVGEQLGINPETFGLRDDPICRVECPGQEPPSEAASRTATSSN
ncbi:MAG: transposase family protein, partial [Nocardioides sp.]|nr:transposase family protein [Nocardioides sp.]